MRLVIADDHALFRDSLRSLLEARGMEIVGEAGNGREALDLARSLQPDVVLMDLTMPEMDGLSATRMISAELPEIKVVILTASSDDSDLFEADGPPRTDVENPAVEELSEHHRNSPGQIASVDEVPPRVCMGYLHLRRKTESDLLRLRQPIRHRHAGPLSGSAAIERSSNAHPRAFGDEPAGHSLLE